MVAWMKIVKSEAPGQFFVVGMDVTKDQRLNLTERGMLLTLLSLPPDWDFTVEGMTKILPDGRDRIRTAMNNLKKYGYVMQVQGRREDGAFDSGHMEIYHKPFDVSGVDDKPPSVLPSSANRTKVTTLLLADSAKLLMSVCIRYVTLLAERIVI